ncbi:hypothetical protein GS506_09175 [Rhodococcus hoagii]|nr:hypothetical protein [Prescottella equi]
MPEHVAAPVLHVRTGGAQSSPKVSPKTTETSPGRPLPGDTEVGAAHLPAFVGAVSEPGPVTCDTSSTLRTCGAPIGAVGGPGSMVPTSSGGAGCGSGPGSSPGIGIGIVSVWAGSRSRGQRRTKPDPEPDPGDGPASGGGVWSTGSVRSGHGSVHGSAGSGSCGPASDREQGRAAAPGPVGDTAAARRRRADPSAPAAGRARTGSKPCSPHAFVKAAGPGVWAAAGAEASASPVAVAAK